MPMEAGKNKARADFEECVVDEPNRTVAFVDRSVGAVGGWLWDFGDGNTSGERNPVHHYKRAGIYNVTLTVQTEEGEKRRVKSAVVAFD